MTGLPTVRWTRRGRTSPSSPRPTQGAGDELGDASGRPARPPGDFRPPAAATTARSNGAGWRIGPDPAVPGDPGHEVADREPTDPQLLTAGPPLDGDGRRRAAWDRAVRGRWSTVRRVAVESARWALDRWQRSLQLRVAATTVLISGLVVLVVGMLSVGAITNGVLDAKRQAARIEAANGVRIAQDQLTSAPREDRLSIGRTLSAVQQSVSRRGTAAGLFSIVVISGNADPFVSGNATASDVPQELRREVEKGRFAEIYAPVKAADGTSTKGLVLGAPVTQQPGSVELYYLFPLQAEQRTLGLVRSTVLLTGILLVALLAGVAALVTGQVVRPVRVAAQTAERFAAGRLQERMRVRGKDDLAALAAAFNDMADSLQRQIGKLEEMSRLQRRFTSDVSHELRTPLTTVRMAADLLHASRGGFEPQVARSAELLQHELDRFESLLADLLEISRYDAHVAVLEPDPADIRGLVRAAVAATGGIAEPVGADVRVDIPEEPVVADVDGRRVERILRNLLVNAIEHSEGRPVEVCLRGDDSAVAVTVRDHGVGLRPGEAALVFDRFWRADPSRDRRTGGTGLGLSISLEDARLHGGWLHAWGRPGQGAQFRLTLPVRNGDVLVSSPLPIEPADATRPTGLIRRLPVASESSR